MKRRSFLLSLLSAPLLPVVAEAARENASDAGAEVGRLSPSAAHLGEMRAGCLRSKDGRFSIDTCGRIVIDASQFVVTP